MFGTDWQVTSVIRVAHRPALAASAINVPFRSRWIRSK